MLGAPRKVLSNALLLLSLFAQSQFGIGCRPSPLSNMFLLGAQLALRSGTDTAFWVTKLLEEPRWMRWLEKIAG